MRRLAVLVKNLAQRIEKYLGVAVIFFALGALFTAWVGRNEAWAQFWTILAAIAALIPAIRSLLPEKVVQTPSAASPPVFRVARVEGHSPYGVSLVFANAESSPVLVVEVHVYDDQDPIPYFARGGFLVPPSSEKDYWIPFEPNPLEGGAIITYFHYGPTAEEYHRISLPFKIKDQNRRKEDGSTEVLDHFFFVTDNQRLESGSKVEVALAETRRFWQENPLRVVDVRPLSAKEEPEEP